jgi:hypothetical protein
MSTTKMAESNLCREKYVDGKLVSRICIRGDIFFLKSDFPRPDYELSVVSTCDSCPTYPPASAEIDKDELKAMLKEILKEILEK